MARIHHSFLKNPLMGAVFAVVMVAALGSTVFLSQRQQDIRQHAATSPDNVIGSIDVASCNVVQGWACDKSDPKNELFVTVAFDGFGQVTTKADMTRAPKAYNSSEIENFLSNSLCKGRRPIGWSVPVPQQLQTDGQTHGITVFAGDTNPAITQVLTTFWDKNESASYSKRYSISCSVGSKTNDMSIESCVPAPGQSSCIGRLKYNFANTNIVHFCRTDGEPVYGESPMVKFSDHSNFQSTGGSNNLPVEIKAGVANNFYMLGAPVGGDQNNVSVVDCSGAELAAVNGVYTRAAPTATPVPTRIPPPVNQPPLGTISGPAAITAGQPIPITATASDPDGNLSELRVYYRQNTGTDGGWVEFSKSSCSGSSCSYITSVILPSSGSYVFAVNVWDDAGGFCTGNPYTGASCGSNSNFITTVVAPPTATPLPPTPTNTIPVATATPSYLRSDFGGLTGGGKDGKVDIQDYNILAGEFYKVLPSYKSNIATSGLSANRVDIQDYNAFVSDFQAYLAR